MNTRNLVCVHWGEAYTPDYVLNLYKGAQRWTRKPFTFHVYTDNAKQHPQNLGWVFHHLPNLELDAPGWWYKMYIFNELNGTNLYIDLDTVIINNLDKFWDHQPGDFLICQDFNRKFVKHFHHVNSSVMRWEDDQLARVYNEFVADPHKLAKQYRGDQDVIDHLIKDRVYWPHDWAMSWRWELYRGGIDKPGAEPKGERDIIARPDTSIMVFHGSPKPHEVDIARKIWEK